MEGVEDVPAGPGLLEPGVHLIRVLQLKQEVRHGSRGFLVFRQFEKICELEAKTLVVSRGGKDPQVCARVRLSAYLILL